MMTYKWTISALDCAVSQNGLTNIVQNIHWRYRATDNEGITAETYGAQYVTDPNPEAFLPFNDLTQEIVISWLEAIMSQEIPTEGDQQTNSTILQEMQSRLMKKIELIKNPVTVTLTLPTTDIIE